MENPAFENILVGCNPAPPRKRYIYAPDYDILGEWVEKNGLYPSRKEKELLATKSNLKVDKVSSWFDRSRRTKRSLKRYFESEGPPGPNGSNTDVRVGRSSSATLNSNTV